MPEDERVFFCFWWQLKENIGVIAVKGLAFWRALDWIKGSRVRYYLPAYSEASLFLDYQRFFLSLHRVPCCSRQQCQRPESLKESDGAYFMLHSPNFR